jgi:hypothetical protein
MNVENQKVSAPVFRENTVLITDPPKPLPKHQYPLFIRLFFGIIFFMSLVLIPRFLILDLPRHRQMHVQLELARKAFDSADYLRAIDFYKEIVVAYPHFKTGRIALAKSFFGRCAQTEQGAYYQFGMWYLEGNKYSYSERQELRAYLPEEYKQDFQNAWRGA